MVALEIAVTDGSGLDAAASGGADRVELCAALGTGGLTPSLGMIEACVERGSLPVHVLVRSRPGDFVVDADHVAVMARDVRAAVAAGASGVVIGAALPDGRLDLDALARLVDAAAGAEVTLHRVFDVVADRAAAYWCQSASGRIRSWPAAASGWSTCPRWSRRASMGSTSQPGARSRPGPADREVGRPNGT